jgi:outer membrane protein assembly factor BamB
MALGLSFGIAAAIARADDWPQFRGPGATALSKETQLPSEWGQDKNVAWKVEIPGVAWSSPIVIGDKVIVTTAITEHQTKPKPMNFGPPGGGGPPGAGRPPGGPGGGRPPGGPGGPGGMGGGKVPDVMYTWEVLCLDRSTGKTLWKKTADEKKPRIATHSTNTYASETPVCDGERIYAYFGMTGVYCFDMDGKKLWSKDLGAFKMMFGFGTGGSPAVAGDLLYVQCDNEEKSFLVALDKKTGDEKWRVDRTDKSSWATPFVWKTKDRTEVVCISGKRIVSYDPANGTVFWELNGLNGAASASPAADDEAIYLGIGGAMGSSGPLFAIKAGAKGDITLKDGATSNEFVLWSQKKGGPPMASPLLYNGYLYICSQRGGMVSCFDAKTGKESYGQARLPQAKGITSSPWAYDDKVFCLDEDGTTFVLKAGPEFKVIGQNKLGEMFWSSPAISGGNLFLRGTDHLFCIK